MVGGCISLLAESLQKSLQSVRTSVYLGGGIG
jgi:hypothetical protein